jgi:hypothetical protein
MATSGTYTFSMSRDDIIKAALRLTTRYGSGETIPPQDITDCALALNMMVKPMAYEGSPLWCIKDYAVPLISGQATYNLSTATGMTLPVRIMDAYIRDSAGNDVSITLESRYDYDTLGQKASPGTPNQGFYDPQLGAGTITLYNVPADSTHTLHVVIQRQIQDFNLAVDTPDFPQEAYRMLRWNLADEISLEYSTPADVRAEITRKAKIYKDEFFASPAAQEQVSTVFTPNTRSR